MFKYLKELPMSDEQNAALVNIPLSPKRLKYRHLYDDKHFFCSSLNSSVSLT